MNTQTDSSLPTQLLRPALSIVIPVYNREAGLNKLMSEINKAVLLGGFEEQIEVIIIDDASTELVELKDEYPFSVKLERNKQNSGAPISREKGFKLSQAPFIHFHDSDDSLSTEWLPDVLSRITKSPNIDLLMTARFDHDARGKHYKRQRYFHKNVNNPRKVKSRLVYRNCMGPLGGVIFSRKVLEKTSFKAFSSCQDWQMYLDAINHSKVLSSLPDTHFIFNKVGDDRISHNPRKKILGHLQLAKITSKKSVFKKNIRLFYLYTCKQHIANKGGAVLTFYKKNRYQILFTYLVVSAYWRLS